MHMSNTERNDRPLYELATCRMKCSRTAIAQKLATQIIETCAPFVPKAITEWDVLDCGSGYGQTSIELARVCRYVEGIEPSRGLFEEAWKAARASALPNLVFRNIGVENLEASPRFDVVVLDNVLEHIPDQLSALQRLHGALRPGGILFIIVPNKLWPIEVHYGLPFLSYLPISLANAYLRLTGRGHDYSDACYAPTYWGVRRLLRRSGFADHRFVVPSNLANTMKGAVWYYRVGASLLRLAPMFWVVSKAFVIVASKKG